MEMQLKTKITIFCIVNLILLILLYNIPINAEALANICVFKNVTGRECWNCGMTRAFLSLLHLDVTQAYQYNSKVLIVFPLTLGVYLYSWYKYIVRKGEIRNE